ncbi:zinc-dependent peptidase [Thauera sp. CAU 1555]|uniref:Zinc-dependent peptidase n=1 Tax=Thauera sedimentorum TaxID=2767595 RepID=A0ABR9BAR2_9RHOO|nr:M90 family metallopeptidase [Thauera sedimentorum]MBC9071603.1 zinc-dependent peptidase [Thauera sedimentorum]MBD8502522.1 zinc-dependent peptidase [Thauera sedimentorum]
MFGWLRRLLARPQPQATVPERLWQRVERRLPFLDFLPAADRQRLRDMAIEFLRDKQFHGAHGFAVTDEIMLGIALQACLPVLNIGLQAYRGWVGIVVYPGDFVIPRQVMDEDGVMHEYDDEVLGEAWEGGPVLVSWFDEDEAPEGVNVVIHEFAHKLDMENGGVDGFPPLPAHMSRKAWSEAFGNAYERFCEQVDEDEDTVLDPYAAEHPGEFFAVASESFFLDPHGLLETFPEVYRQLAAYYRLDPAHAGEQTGR